MSKVYYSLPEFEEFPKMPKWDNMELVITQKMHGTNACINIYCKHCAKMGHTIVIGQKCECTTPDYGLICGKRTAWITTQSDNFGFALFCYVNKDELIAFLGPGIHWGEWCGPGINKDAGEGLSVKTLYLFNYWREYDMAIKPKNVEIIPVLYFGKNLPGVIEKTCEKLKVEGSAAVPGYMNPEGVVITLNRVRYKKPFNNEETHWAGVPKAERPAKEKVKKQSKFITWAQPMRLEKLFSRDESFIPKLGDMFSIHVTAERYITDLQDENAVPDEIAADKDFFGYITGFIKQYLVAEKNNKNNNNNNNN